MNLYIYIDMCIYMYISIYREREGAYCYDININMGKWEGLFMKVFIRNRDNWKQDEDSKL